MGFAKKKWVKLDENTSWRYTPDKEFVYTYRCHAGAGYLYLSYKCEEDIISDLHRCGKGHIKEFWKLRETSCELILQLGGKRVVSFKFFDEETPEVDTTAKRAAKKVEAKPLPSPLPPEPPRPIKKIDFEN